MSASVASLAQAKDVKRTVEQEAVAALDENAKLALAVEALTAIAGENDLTCMRALFRMRRRAEEALARIRPARLSHQSTLLS